MASLRGARRIVVKVGGGARGAGASLVRFLERCGAVAVHTPLATGIVPASHGQNMGVGGSKGSLCGNHAMETADLVVAVGTRFVCQSDSSRTGYPAAQAAITINPDPFTANHYGRNVPLVGAAGPALDALCERLDAAGHRPDAGDWLAECGAKREEWRDFVQARLDRPVLHDPVWGREVLTQPAAIHAALDWARQRGAVSFFDAGDVQANGFQLAQDEAPGQTVTETGASYMGFAASALLATAMASRPFYGLAFTGDGSFTMNPQILIDGAAQGARGCILLLDNRRMAAISGLQQAQYGAGYATWDHLPVDYVAWARAVHGVQGLEGGHDVPALIAALEKARAHDGLSLVHVPVYAGPDPLGGLGAFGRWNVGSWVDETQRLRHEAGL
ncbi:MAG: thiamine pyrophosphate-binding protein [Deltaproteobacteria bacterium]|nr:thiamine pyrophosphate-binding protein [Deltaproteobacteria bacterium]